MKKVKENKKSTLLLKIVSIICICIALIAVSVFGLYKLITYQWQDEPQNYPVTNQYITELGDTMVSAHRAGKKLFPQGTLMAFEGCINSEDFETDIFEFDLHLTADDKLIVLHDDTLDDTSNAAEYFGKTDNYPEDYTYRKFTTLTLVKTSKIPTVKLPIRDFVVTIYPSTCVQ